MAGCGGGDQAAREAEPPPSAVTGAQAEAARLGGEALAVLDEVTAYATSRRRTPRSLREAGVDSLTTETARWLEPAPDGVRVWVGFRRPGTHVLVACSVDRQALEDAGLAVGTYRAVCRDAEGARRPMEVARE